MMMRAVSMLAREPAIVVGCGDERQPILKCFPASTNLPATRTTHIYGATAGKSAPKSRPSIPPEAGVDIAQFLVDLCPEVADFHLILAISPRTLSPEIAHFSPEIAHFILSLEIGDLPVQLGERFDHPADHAGNHYGCRRYENRGRGP